MAVVTNVSALSEEDKKKVRLCVRELNDSMLRSSAERELQKEALKIVAAEVGVDKKLVRRMAKAYFKSNFTSEVEANTAFEEFYSKILKTV